MTNTLPNLPEAQRLLRLMRNVEIAETRLRLARLVLQDELGRVRVTDDFRPPATIPLELAESLNGQ